LTSLDAPGPEFMPLQDRWVVLIEPMAPDFRLARLIRLAKMAPAHR